MTTSLLPPNATPLERAVEAATARFANLDVPLRDLLSPDRCPAALLPWLAWSLSIDVWSPDWSEEVKRAQIRVAIQIQRTKGTASAVRMAVESFGAGVALQEWWQKDPPGPPHTFDLTLSMAEDDDGVPLSAVTIDQIIAKVHRTKPLRSHFTFTLALRAKARFGLAGAARAFIFNRIGGEVAAIGGIDPDHPSHLLLAGGGALLLASGGKLLIRG
jgi:phage tail P2-like protein